MEQKLKILVVEDEMLIAAKIALFLAELGYEVTAILTRAEEAIAHVAEHMPDMALLDVRLAGEMDGITLADELNKFHQMPVIFLTANADDATFSRAKAVKPFAFLQKPFRKMELQRTIELALQRLETESTTPEEAEPKTPEDNSFLLNDRIFVRYNDKLIKIMFDSILHVDADRSYCRIVTREKDYLLTMPMKRLGDKLPTNSFQRIHRSHIVHLRHVDEVSDGLVTIAGKSLPLSPTLKDAFLKRFNTV